MMLLSIDPSLHSSGFAIFQSGKRGKLVASGAIKIPAKITGSNAMQMLAEKVAAFKMRLKEKFPESTELMMAIESQFAGKSWTSIHDLGIVSGIWIGGICPAKIIFVSPSSWGSYWKLPKLREDRKKMSLVLAASQAHKKIETTDESDAILLGLYTQQLEKFND